VSSQDDQRSATPDTSRANLINRSADIDANSHEREITRDGKSSSLPRQEPKSKNNSATSTAAAVAAVSAKSLGHLFVIYAKCALVDLPFAVTEGLRVVPLLHGETPRDYGRVTDWKSGAVAASKAFTFGVGEGLSDIFVLPVKGGIEQGTKGVFIGLGKGAINIVSKTGTGVLGLISYQTQGISKSIRSAVYTTTAEKVKASKQTEGVWLSTTQGYRMDVAATISNFRNLRKGKKLCAQH
jgi:hypothetical protein